MTQATAAGATAATAPVGSGATAAGSDPTAELERPRRWWTAIRLGRFGLRTRILLLFTLGALLLAGLLATAAYSFTRSSLVTQSDKSAVADARRNAAVAQGEIDASPSSAQAAANRLDLLGVERPAIFYRDRWTVGAPRFGPDQIPQELKARVIEDGVAARMTTTVEGEAVIAVGIPLPDVNASYFEFFSLEQVDDTLGSVGVSLLFGAFITSLFSVLLGTFAAARAVRPLGEAAQAAKAIAGGRLDTRLEPTDDRDLRLLANSFNEMASALQLRVERDARFASDVSHELRSPLMTLAASAEVMQARRGEMPERAQVALDLLVSDVARFQGLVEDLLEISRFDAGAVRLHREDLLVAELVRQAVAVSSMPATPVHVSARAEAMIMQGDRRRLARVVANLIDNARLHGGGEVTVTVTEADGEGEPLGHVWIAVEDEGPGVAPDERELIFERFARGGVAGRRSSSDGAGLGLALVDEHVRLHGGRIWVEDRADGRSGARFVLELPAEEAGV